MKVPAHSQAAVRSGFSVRVGSPDERDTDELGVLSGNDCEKNVRDVLGRKSAVKASRLVCTPTIEVYLANGKNGTSWEVEEVAGSLEGVDGEPGVIFWGLFAAFLFDMDDWTWSTSSRWSAGATW